MGKGRRKSRRKKPARRAPARRPAGSPKRKATKKTTPRAAHKKTPPPPETRSRTAPRAARLRGWTAEVRNWVSTRWARLPEGMRSPANLALGAVLAALVAALVVLLLVRATPGAYRDPAQVSDEQLIRWGEGFVHKLNTLLTQVVNRERFDVTFTEDELNGYLSSFFRPRVRRALSARLSDEYRLDLPAGFRGPVVHLREGEAVLMARYEGWRLRPVVSAVGVVELDSEGRMRLRLTRLRAGLLPLPVSWVSAAGGLERKSISLGKKHILLERVEIRPGKLRLVGRYADSEEGTTLAPPR